MSESSAEKIWNHVTSLPEPLQSVLKRKLTDDSVSAPVRDIAKRFNLSEDQSGLFETEATLAVVGLTDPSTFKDDLIAEVGLNYETAVRVQRAFENEVLLPIRTETEAAAPPPPIPASPGIDSPLYKDSFCRITYSTLDVGSTNYRMSSIASVSQPIQFPFEFFGGFLLNGALFLFGLWAISHFTTGWLIVGLIAAAIVGYNVYSQFNRDWWVTVSLTSGKELEIKRRKKAEIYAIYAAFRKALGS